MEMENATVGPNNNIFEVLGFGKEEAANLLIRSHLLSELQDFIKASGMTLRGAADHFGVSHPRISDLMKGRIDKFKIDYLVNLLSKTGKRMTIQIEDLDPA